MANDQSKETPFFALKKIYVDMITDNGEYFIGYSARLKFGSLKLNYSATLSSALLQGIKHGPILSSSDETVVNGSSLSWDSECLGFKGLWLGSKEALNHTLLETSEGLINWECLQPVAHVELQTKSGKRYEGSGYAELLSMTILPWRLGLKTLYWGRFVSDTHSVVWIEWQGKHPLKLLILNGQNMPGSVISNSHINCDAFELSLDREAIIRMGSLGNTVFSKVPSIFKLAPVEFLNVKEEKFLSRGMFKSFNGEQTKGWVIHEKIIWA